MSTTTSVTVARGDGIGPEIMDATLAILRAAQVPVAFEEIEVGEAVYLRGETSGIPDEAWESIRRTGVLLKAPITTPQGGGYKSLNVALRKSLGLFANVRQCRAYSPYVASNHPGMDMVIVRENEEDLYAGIEYRQSGETYTALKILSEPGTDDICRYAFEYARAYGRRRVTCMTKDNIMKFTDGMFHKVFQRIAREYPDIESGHQIIDIGAARVAAQPERLDVVVTLNLYGDIISDIAAQVAGSVGLAGSANIGRDAAMFEAIHGSAPDIAGKEIANPSGLLLAAVEMLVHIGCASHAETIMNAWLTTLEDGVHTPDIFREGLSRQQVGTKAFTDAVIERLGRTPHRLVPAHYRSFKFGAPMKTVKAPTRRLVGADLYVEPRDGSRDPAAVTPRIAAIPAGRLTLEAITNRGVEVWPEGHPRVRCLDTWRCRYVCPDGNCGLEPILDVMAQLDAAGFEVCKSEHLYTFDGKPGYSAGE